ncbi:larval cuticle protein A3A-like [Bradysia coprophila]|uniref:larval cuticle protein A3A-like n=1 Tax=Bradysia coprophila TaxID=38358 RepID=UPI00187DBA77|nr:larval cuticle protein A3A-like [Bradysia coprophila]
MSDELLFKLNQLSATLEIKMALRFALTFALISVAASIAIPVEHYNDHNESPAEYEFSYAVNDHSTGDIKSHQESRKGNTVTGKYELIDSDGFRRIVEYTADEHNGFNAIVHREPTDIKIPIFESHHVSHHEPAHYYAHEAHSEHFNGAHFEHFNGAHLEHKIAVQQPYVAPKVAKTTTVKPAVNLAPIVVAEPDQEEEHKAVEVKYVAPAVKVFKPVEHAQLNTHVSYTAPEFNYHY